MIVHTMSYLEMVTEARKDQKAMLNKLDVPLRRTRREMIQCKQELLHMLPWRSTNGNNWLLLVHQRKSGARIYSMAWYLDHDGRVNALWVNRAGMAFHISRHVIERYGERFDPTGSPLERLQGFFLENYLYAVEPTGQEADGKWSVSIGMNHGLGLGVWDQANSLVEMRTFVNHGQLFQNQDDDMERLDLERTFLALSPGHRRALIAVLRNSMPADTSEAAKAWLIKMAA